MKVVLSLRAEEELSRLLRESVHRFGDSVAAATLVLTKQPNIGRHLPERSIHRYVVARTPFVSYYQIRKANVLVLAIRHGAQNRAEFEPE